MEKKLFYKPFAAFFYGRFDHYVRQRRKKCFFFFCFLDVFIKEGKNVFSFSFVEVFFHLLYIVAFDKDDALPMINERLGP